MRENPDDHSEPFDGGNDLQASATVRAMLDIDVEDPFEQTRPTHARRRTMRVPGCICVGIGIVRRPRHDCGTQIGIGREHPMEADQCVGRVGAA